MVDEVTVARDLDLEGFVISKVYLVVEHQLIVVVGEANGEVNSVEVGEDANSNLEKTIYLLGVLEDKGSMVV